MIVGDTVGPLPKGIGHIMRMSFLATKFGDLDLTRKSILFLLPPSRGVGIIKVTTTPVTLASSTSTPPAKGLVWDRGIGGHPIIIRGVMMAKGRPSPSWASHKTQSRTTPCPSTPGRVSSKPIVLSGGLRSGLRLEWSGSGRECRV